MFSPLRTVSVMAATAVAAVLLEAFLAVAFIRPRWRRAGVVLGVAFHLGVITTMVPVFELVIFAVAMVALYPLFFPPPFSSAASRQSRSGASSVRVASPDARASRSPHPGGVRQAASRG